MPLWQVSERIAGHALVANLEVEMGAGAVPRVAHATDLLARCHTFTWLDVDAIQVGIERGEAIALVNDHVVAIASVPAACRQGHIAAIRRFDRRARPGTDVDGCMTAPEALVDGASRRPNEVAAADLGISGRCSAA